MHARKCFVSLGSCDLMSVQGGDEASKCRSNGCKTGSSSQHLHPSTPWASTEWYEGPSAYQDGLWSEDSSLTTLSEIFTEKELKIPEVSRKMNLDHLKVDDVTSSGICKMNNVEQLNCCWVPLPFFKSFHHTHRLGGDHHTKPPRLGVATFTVVSDL